MIEDKIYDSSLLEPIVNFYGKYSSYSIIEIGLRASIVDSLVDIGDWILDNEFPINLEKSVGKIYQ